MAEFEIIEGEALDVLKTFGSGTIAATVVSPPYWHKRDYGHPRQLGQEATPEEYIERLADVFTEVWRVTADTGSLWVNIDDTYFNGSLVGIPWLLAFALKKRGWFLRCDPIWYKTNSTPDPAENRFSRTHEYIFHFTKCRTGYYFDMASVREPYTSAWARDCLAKFIEVGPERPDMDVFNKQRRHASGKKGVTRAQMGALMNPLGRSRRAVFTEDVLCIEKKANPGQIGLRLAYQSAIPRESADSFEPLRLDLVSVMTLATNKFRGRHYAPYPKNLVSPLILASCPQDGIVLDCFCGAANTGLAALENGRDFIGIELIAASAAIAREELKNAPPGLHSQQGAVDGGPLARPAD